MLYMSPLSILADISWEQSGICLPWRSSFILSHMRRQLIQMGLIKEPKAHALTMQYGKQSSNHKSKHKGKEKHK